MRLHHVQVACPRGGEAEARRFYAEGIGLTEVDKPEALAGRGGAWFRAYDGPPGEGRVAAELHVGVEEPFSAARKAHPAFVVEDDAQLLEIADRLTRKGYVVDRAEWATFPGHHRVHAFDGAGNRVELLAPLPM
jgi:catechol 2,3-dioxygenase-like lactoylglutathione lyase family enzyme